MATLDAILAQVVAISIIFVDDGMSALVLAEEIPPRDTPWGLWLLGLVVAYHLVLALACCWCCRTVPPAGRGTLALPSGACVSYGS